MRVSAWLVTLALAVANVLAMLLAAAGLVTPAVAIVVMVVSIFGIVLNTLRIRGLDLGHEERVEAGALSAVEYVVPKMVCEGCAETIGAALQRVAGVREVKSKISQKRVYVQYEPARIREDEIRKVLDENGFTAVEA